MKNTYVIGVRVGTRAENGTLIKSNSDTIVREDIVCASETEAKLLALRRVTNGYCAFTIEKL